MKTLTPLLVLISTVTMSLSAVAQYLPPLDPARQAERDAVYGPNYGPDYGRGNPGYLTPGNSGNYNPDPYRPVPNNPYNPGRPTRPTRPPVRPYPPAPPSGPYYGNDYGPQYTVRWQDYGVNQVPKLISQRISLNVGGLLVNEVLLRSIEGSVQIESALAYLWNGQVVDLRQITGTIYKGQEIRGPLDYRYSLRVNRIEIQASSANLIGSRGQLQVYLGFAQ